MEIGILGGTFNPIHIGHLIVAEQIMEWFRLNQIYFIPSAIPPHKEGPILEGYHRLKMVNCAIGSNPHFLSSSMEIDRGGYSYTIDTICELKEKLGKGHTLFFIIGVDAFKDISTWKEYKRLLTLCRFIVISRPGLDLESMQKEMVLITKELKLKDRLIQKNKGSGYNALFPIVYDQTNIFYIPVPLIDISSTLIRELVRKGFSIRYQVPKAVEEYIKANRLYRDYD